MAQLKIDSTQSRIRIRTFAEGLLSRLAHDLELECRALSGTANLEDKFASIEAPIEKIEIAGTLKNGKVDPSGISASDRADCLAKMQNDVFHVREGVVRGVGKLEGSSARITLTMPKGREVERVVPVRVQEAEDRVTVSGSFELSLKSVGSDPVKGPMNAFRVKDQVELSFDLIFLR